MNRDRRKRLTHALESLQDAIDIINEVKDDEQAAADNFPENLQTSDIFENMEVSIDTMEDAINDVESAMTQIATIL